MDANKSIFITRADNMKPTLLAHLVHSIIPLMASMTLYGRTQEFTL